MRNGWGLLPDPRLCLRSVSVSRVHVVRSADEVLCVDAMCFYPGDVPMNRVKMNAKHEYEFIANFKILQNVFRAKKLEKARP